MKCVHPCRSKTKLADLQAEQAANAKEEILELQKAVEELQRIAKESSDRSVLHFESRDLKLLHTSLK